ncbi:MULTISPECIES: SpoIIIAH-like family protein [unclassified Sporosarcina]|uniref:SpoIIIAH-like family protein n=1 Tax=unclassified Sporosarcina TaxID=2647733 RepID=UPI000C16EF16|nr:MULTISPECIES: SpoIIIAH-like family protein [unclassified Sporosarcina]PID00381.1 stage III sporulation protein AH [Sporosarcina sp. P29]PID06624.1 stage III sporulation protein AH [Sporosarcina sp. P30]PID09818.1 stage III sporulation protein AH [Sporosarcina sp. P31]PID13397.1 stage III sporulation protein AH [Sporosarcina sp. P32b]
MKANKRTVWFLTLLSLVAVISIYYVKKEAPMPFDGIAIFTKETKDATNLLEKEGKSEEVKPVFAESYIFQDMRMEVRNERSETVQQLTEKMTSSDFSAEEKNEIFNEIADLRKVSSTEALMEMQIAALGYPEVFVRGDGDRVNVTVLSNESHSPKMADEITQYVMSSWDGAQTVKVDFAETKE